MLFDACVVLVILGGIFLGTWKGLAWQVAGIVSLVAGFGIAIPLSKPLAPLFGSAPPLNRFIALAVLYGLVSLGTYLAAFYYRQVIQKWQLGNWDRHLGGVMGAIKGFLFCATAVFFAITLFRGLREPLLTTRSGKLMGHTMMAIHGVWPPGVHEIIHPYTHHLDEQEGPKVVPAPAPIPKPSPAHPR